MLGIKNKTKKASKKKESSKVETSVLKRNVDANVSHVLIRPHITEKAARLAEAFAYTFEIAGDANKVEVKKAIKSLYGVTPRKVTIVNSKPRNVVVRGRRGVTAPVKKAVVFLGKGQVIEFV